MEFWAPEKTGFETHNHLKQPLKNRRNPNHHQGTNTTCQSLGAPFSHVTRFLWWTPCKWAIGVITPIKEVLKKHISIGARGPPFRYKEELFWKNPTQHAFEDVGCQQTIQILKWSIFKVSNFVDPLIYYLYVQNGRQRKYVSWILNMIPNNTSLCFSENKID